MDLFDCGANQRAVEAREQDGQELSTATANDELVGFMEGDEPLRENERVEKKWRF